jgi:hypothetical protein
MLRAAKAQVNTEIASGSISAPRRKLVAIPPARRRAAF